MSAINFIDIETTGLNPWQHQAIEVGIVKACKGEILDEIEFSLPFDESAADPKALEVNGWGQRSFAPQVGLLDAQKILEAQFADNEFFCAWHTNFDEVFLKKLFLEDGAEVPWHHSRVIDLPSLILGNAGIITKGSIKEIAPQFRLRSDFAGKHTALNDARFNERIFNKLNLWENYG